MQQQDLIHLRMLVLELLILVISRIGEEIISYESASGTTITITERGIDSTTAKNYPAGTKVL